MSSGKRIHGRFAREAAKLRRKTNSRKKKQVKCVSEKLVGQDIRVIIEYKN
jgi:hypothetical protein